MVKKISVLALAGLLALPVMASAGAGGAAATTSDMQAQMDALTKQLNALKAQMAQIKTAQDDKFEDFDEKAEKWDLASRFQWSGDIRNRMDVDTLIHSQAAAVVYHLAAQVAVTTSVMDPRHDFEINALGAFNVLEAIRTQPHPPVLLFASTNKVYGGMEHIRLVEQETRYEYADHPEGIDETCPLDFHSPYGCSKGCADQYVRDYARLYGLRTVVFRQSAIFGPRQFGIEDQGWAAWFSIAALKGTPITIYGDGKQVRDLLWVDDLVDAYLQAVERAGALEERVFNVGGGAQNTISIWKEFGPLLEREIGRPLAIRYDDWRPGDQKVCVMNIQKASRTLNWSPQVSVEEGTHRLVQWVKEHLAIL